MSVATLCLKAHEYRSRRLSACSVCWIQHSNIQSCRFMPMSVFISALPFLQYFTVSSWICIFKINPISQPQGQSFQPGTNVNPLATLLQNFEAALYTVKRFYQCLDQIHWRLIEVLIPRISTFETLQLIMAFGDPLDPLMERQKRTERQKGSNKERKNMKKRKRERERKREKERERERKREKEREEQIAKSVEQTTAQKPRGKYHCIGHGDDLRWPKMTYDLRMFEWLVYLGAASCPGLKQLSPEPLLASLLQCLGRAQRRSRGVF